MFKCSVIKPVLEQCVDCDRTVTCRCGLQVDGTYYYDWSHSHWGLGDTRCGPCTVRRKDEFHKQRVEEFMRERVAYESHVWRGKHEGECPDDGVVCESCCEHEFDSSEGYMCLHCGVNGMEAMADAGDYGER